MCFSKNFGREVNGFFSSEGQTWKGLEDGERKAKGIMA